MAIEPWGPPMAAQMGLWGLSPVFVKPAAGWRRVMQGARGHDTVLHLQRSKARA